MLRSSEIVRFQNWRDARFAGRPWRSVLVVAALMTITAGAMMVVDNSVVILPSAWLLILVAIGAILGGWRVGLATTALGALALWGVVQEQDAIEGLSPTRSVWAVFQFLLAGGGVSVAIGGIDRSIREMRRAAHALEASEQRSRQITLKLQRAIIPEDPPAIPGLEIAARYLPADSSEVGGDFYDWYRAAEDTWCMQIGDVCGKGPAAASRALLARYTLRAAAMLDGDPVRMLFALNSAIMAEQDERFCTAAVLRLSVNHRVQADLALGGHPHALILREDRVLQFGREGSLVGVFDTTDFSCDRTDLRPGDRLFLYTDGVTDRAGAPLDDPELHALLIGLAPLTVPDFAAELERQLLATPGTRDDITFVVIGVPA